MGQRILLIDDEEGIRKVLGITLEDIGYVVLSAENGEEALRLFRKTAPPIVLTDIKMPGIDGIQVLKTIKEESPDTEVIMITGHGDMELAIRSLKFDATDFITKPINDDALEIALKRANEKITLRAKLKEYTENLELLVEEKTKKILETERLAAIGQTVGGLAHAIKNIAGGLTGGAFVLEKGIDLHNEKYLHEGWDMVKGNLARIKGMALDLLSYTKERDSDCQLLDPNSLAQEIADLMLPRASENDVSLEIELDESLFQVWLDPEGIHRCLLNLVTNAIDACINIDITKRQGRVILRTLKTEGWAVEFQVVDNGCGMGEEIRGKIFRRFFSTKGSRGTGLGLMITKKIINEHKGAIEFDSEKGKGTRFVIRLPEKDQSTSI